MKTKYLFFLWALLFVCLTPGVRPDPRAEFVGNFPTGLLQLEKKVRYYLFVPQEYSPDKGWPLLVLVGERGEDPRKAVQNWVDWAKQNQILILALPNLVPERESPDVYDRWLFEVKYEISLRYRIDPNEILIVGIGGGAHYSAYLTLKYPDEFTAAALFRRAWPGPLESLSEPVSKAARQPSFYLALDPESPDFPQVEKKALQLEKKGYEVALDRLKPDEDFTKLRDRMLQWFRYQSETRALAKESADKGWSGAIRKGVRKFFEV
jgi:hypothetical protein